eukprot:TRINITY_DN8348_c0_g1_i8.p1 TRINITY_DN8348_c0_g1~~TRINITY_DN8348_c0_g1_i8.p1  ORF type:complete len:279 (+),score=63.22 TRINITY_DN8348_c0_g1_i8:460-1296(+)
MRAIREERSTDLRANLFSKLSSNKGNLRKPPKIFMDSSYNLGGNIPTASGLGIDDFPSHSKNRLNDSFVNRAMTKITSDVEKILAFIDEKAYDAAFKGSISLESFKRSVHGRFSDTYKQLKAIVDPDQLSLAMSTAFKGSNIVNHYEGVVLYFNLPLTATWLPKPKKIFPVDEKPERFTIKELLFEFERSNNNTPNIILVQDEGQDERFGGYASESWSTNKPKCGSSECFLFNLKKNIRFDTVKGKGFYQFCPSPSCIKFGETDLVLNVLVAATLGRL